MKNITYKIYTLGCKVNQYDSSDLSRKLDLNGFVRQEKKTDIVIVNTCVVTKTAVHKCKRIINKVRSENLNAKVIVMGCMPVVYRDMVEKLNVDIVWGVGELDKLVERIRNKELGIKNKNENNFEKINNLSKSRYFIKVQDGCEQFCSYCIVPYTRGKIKSREKDEILKEIDEAVGAGYREIVLSGTHLGLYGKDLGKINLSDLIIEIIKIKDLGRVRLSSIEINEVTDEMIELMKTGKLCPHLPIPLQSGCDKILKLMNRPYDTKYFRKKIEKIKQTIPDIAITTDVIVGFPGETEKDFQKTVKFIKDIKFSRLHVFPFSAHEKTPASKMSGQVSREEKARRAKILRELGSELENDYKKKFIGKELKVVLMNNKKGKARGKSEYYFDVEIKDKKVSEKSEGKIISIKYKKFD